jgi:hypothetical protein
MKYRIYNTQLNPDIWNGLVLNKKVKDKLIQVANDFYKDTELTAPIIDILFVGSLANYNWSNYSDFDLHIVINFKNVDDNSELIEKYVNQLKSSWNKDHDIHINGYNVEVFIQDVTKQNRSSGVYSLLTGNWISKPKYENFSVDNNLIQNKYNDVVYKINCAIKESNLELLKTTLKDVYDMRQAGLDRGGELSTENLVFKILRSRGHLKKLTNAITSTYDKQISMDK